ncbi:MAG: 3,4-dihydroxy-2-butanone-4-phosphate synthase [Actinomycetaceae bacterium]|nr:3,4-dihydroxy-2-butanone-4-phosphate synthase [Actinomycetaceae bacterium]
MRNFAEKLPLIIADLRAGKPVLVADDVARENEVDAIWSAAAASEHWVAWVIRHSSGYICAPMTAIRADALELPLMVTQNQDSFRTAYTVTCDAAQGVTTGISAADRSHTLHVLARKQPDPSALVRPGHVVPLRARPGGVLTRPGHTEAAVDLMRLAGLEAVGGICELVADDGTMMRQSGAAELAREYDLQIITIAELVAWRKDHDLVFEDAGSGSTSARVKFIAHAKLPTAYGNFTIRAYRDLQTGAEHVALVPEGNYEGTPTVRVHSECLTGDSFGSARCDCGPQLREAMEIIVRTGGAVVYLRGHEGRGIGLAEKIRAYALQDQGQDTAQANLSLGWPIDLREYGAAAEILRDLGMTRINLLTNNPDKQVLGDNIEIVDVLPLEVGVGPDNIRYLRTKAKLGHRFSTLDVCAGE